ncbi:hypothetical protein PG994_008600 [Apiospora phragmitis]|uniref:Heterokaryon incompatibility domain-containing protein n=1 Tax=Apiospora phragmitis TaxID=2905665 RepID=A0ABR1UGY5_9PEZI
MGTPPKPSPVKAPLNMKSSSHTSVIRCELIETSLEDPPQYTALSYAWGDADDTVNIEVNGIRTRVTSSLQGALRALRRSDDTLLIWADAICIDQSNKAEQSSQVRPMATIYSKAESVVVWIGPRSPDSSSAIPLALELCNASDSEGKVESCIEKESNRDYFAALVNLFERDYWSRLWVVQEILSAKSVTVCCREGSIPWGVLQELMAVLERHEDILKHCFPSGFARGSRHRQSFAHILLSGRASQCWRARDIRRRGRRNTARYIANLSFEAHL